MLAFVKLHGLDDGINRFLNEEAGISNEEFDGINTEPEDIDASAC